MSFDEGLSLLSPPGFDLFFASDRSVYFSKGFNMDQAMDSVPRCKTSGATLSMLHDTSHDVVCDTGVQHSGSARENVDKVILIHVFARPNPKPKQIPLYVARPPLRGGKCKGARDSARNDMLG